MSICVTCGFHGLFASCVLREMFFDTRSEFRYETCSRCGSIQLAERLSSAELSEHYPFHYYAFEDPKREVSPVKRHRLRQRADFLFGNGRNLAGRLLTLHEDDWLLRPWISYGLERDMRVLDVGCGSGHLLHALADRGMTSLMGVDPFIPAAIDRAPIRIAKGTIDDVEGCFDFITFNHSLEHVPDPLATLTRAATLLAPEGTVVVRLPTCSSDAFRIYGKDWLQLDPPRHTFVPSRVGMAELGRRAGLIPTAVTDDSVGFQFWGSEQYRRDIALTDPRSYFSNPAASIFSAEEIADYESRAQELNALGRGDQAAFQFRRGDVAEARRRQTSGVTDRELMEARSDALRA